jgi:spore germination protein
MYDRYIVQPRDSLYTIARKYKTNVDGIKYANRLPTNTIYIGQSLAVPVHNQRNTYMVQPGDSLSTIAAKFGVSIEELRKSESIAVQFCLYWRTFRYSRSKK